jgi:hypothetical protein
MATGEGTRRLLAGTVRHDPAEPASILGSPPLFAVLANGGGSGWGFGQYRSNCFKHGLDIVKHVIICETHDPIATLRLQPLRALSIILLLQGMNVTVNLNDQLRPCAEEVDDEISDRMLFPEVGASQLMATETLPELDLSRGHLAT